ncbi:MULTISPECIES: AzlC family ABC transporter permease [Mesorhizobium]|uniref:Branched-chain amino acid ABC transporter permease n=1 Tax=Mesorhizobium denitrificans TaxID=2294114 RepID=A0A371XG60_9HYPH|nr:MULTISPECIES: AzlC family ABC transporter permease [Mesorhizobium]RFC68210.1 branched-chain amino acid ABC transporter permease [Mesorhizobium denitrificans]
MSAEIITQLPARRSSLSEFLDGARRAIPVVVASSPFAVLFGALAIDNGLTPFDALFMSMTVFGGASQMVGIELFGHKIAPWLIVLSIFAVNFRHVLYSAAIGRHFAHWPLWQQALAYFLLTDPQFAEAESRAQRERVPFAWYFGMGLCIYVFWNMATLAGALFGRLIPDPHAIGLDFLLPIYFLGIVMGFRKRPMWLPLVLVSGVASMIAYKFVGSPWHVSLGALAGIILALIVPPSSQKA